MIENFGLDKDGDSTIARVLNMAANKAAGKVNSDNRQYEAVSPE